jgi:hypothetical protein
MKITKMELLALQSCMFMGMIITRCERNGTPMPRGVKAHLEHCELCRRRNAAASN